MVETAVGLLSAAPGWVDGLRVRPLVEGALDFLPRAWDEERALYSFSATLGPAGELVQDWSHPQTVRYTINSLLGLHAAQGAGALPAIEAFASRHASQISSPADLGLFAVLTAECGDDARAASALAGIDSAATLPSVRLNMQDLGWMLWGACACARAGVSGGDAAARRLLDRILEEFVHPRTGLPVHSLRPYRRNVVSFGSLVYFLRSLHEAAHALGDERAAVRFRDGVERAIAVQGPPGEWPWMIDVARGRAFDRYPVFGVHQDSMSMLFLLPAVAAGAPGASQAVERSLRWVHGENELGLRMVVDEPFFFAYRAIERDERAAKARRYARWLAHGAAEAAPAGSLRVNRECRSYHLGWILYAWARLLERPSPLHVDDADSEEADLGAGQLRRRIALAQLLPEARDVAAE
ncbi:MAG: hypothetical protein QOK22_77 [Gaiellaceae bacterium]|nr:hypothetical protein [Gaiellaceae bacterium]